MTPSEKAMGLVVRHFNDASADYPDGDVPIRAQVTEEDVREVWFTKTLQHWKGMYIVLGPNNLYYEVTYNGDKHEAYVDVYDKLENVRYEDSPEEITDNNIVNLRERMTNPRNPFFTHRDRAQRRK